MTPTRFGYRLHSPLGKGTWGLFYSVEDPITGTPYALKLVRLDSKVDSQRLLQRLEREWTIGQSLTHSVQHEIDIASAQRGRPCHGVDRWLAHAGALQPRANA
jgi:serine/threonine protein kinase